jgi:orotidine-5'-phosphate decarboxylase
MTPNLLAMKNIQTSSPTDRLIFALDIGSNREEALSWVKRLKDHVGLFKVGKEVFTHFGPDIVRDIQELGGKVFLDLKFHDIPNTVARAAEAATKLGVSMFNIHALGGITMMKETAASVKALADKKGYPLPLILAVTVLTSLNNEDLSSMGFQYTTEELVVRLSNMARMAGLSGVVASARDVAAIRSTCGGDFIIVTPGIRGTQKVAGDDQKRTLSPAEAIREGADYLVVGRPIRMAKDPVDEAQKIVQEIAEGLSMRQA